MAAANRNSSIKLCVSRFDLFHGDASFKPVDWRIRITPEISINDLNVRELGIVGPDVRSGTNRFDTHVGLQEAFAEVKLHDLGPNYDFVSLRAGIQQFNADFRGFLFVDEQPAVRIFGDLHSDKIEYNAAYFQFLEKNTNSGLNTFERRHQQVVLGNVYLQDFFFPGYTAEFVAAWNKDDATIHYDDNGFLVRPAPVGNVINQNPGAGPIPHGIRVGYFGWLGSGHIHTHQCHARVLSGRRRRHVQSDRWTSGDRECATRRCGNFLRSRLDPLSRLHFLHQWRRQSARWPRARLRFHPRSRFLCRRSFQLLESRRYFVSLVPAFC